MMIRELRRLFLLCIVIATITNSLAFAQQTDKAAEKKPTEEKKPTAEEKARQRENSLRALAKQLNVGPGATIADIGAGKGRDTWVFADIVGERGKVFAEEITEKNTKAIEEELEKRKLPQVHVVLGNSTSPALPDDLVDMAFMHRVYHHVAKPKEMLQAIWKSLKPGGYLVIVDQRRGTLTDWGPRADREKKHFWIAETTVVRDARENGYEFVQYADEDWYSKDPFVLVFRRPTDADAPGGDPDVASALDAETAKLLTPPKDKAHKRVALVALGEGRKLVGPLLNATPCEAVDIVLEEWATQKDERPPLPEGIEMPSVLTEKGDPKLGPEPLDAVYFLDTYHLLFHGPTLLAKLHERLGPSGVVYIMDRQSPKPIPHREASHRRMIAPETVREEMAAAGFALLRESPRPAKDRFLLIFGKAKADKAEEDAAPGN